MPDQVGPDLSIYKNPENTGAIQFPDFLKNAEAGMRMSQLGLQNQQAQMAMQQTQLAMRQQQAMRDAYIKNTDADGNVNKQGVMSELGKMGYGQSAGALGEQFSAQDKAAAEAKAKQMEAAQQRDSMIAGHLDYLKGVPDEQKGTVYGNIRSDLIKKGVINPKDVPEQYDPGLVNQIHDMYTQNKPYLDNQMTKVGIGEKQAQTAKSYAEANKLESETYKRNPDILGQTDDPAKLVPGYVPKEHQAKAFSEIDSAENTKRMSGNIMDAFEKATQENTNLKTGFGFLRTPGSVMALHQSLQPTFKDLEGTVRQAAMDNTFKNITPAPGDSDTKVEEKRQALIGYLQSKASAPTARAYGIDLAKFESTSPYKSAAKQSQSGDSLGGKSAYASDTIKMMSPDGKIKMVPIGMKGEAIAAGGKVIQ